MTEKIRLDTWLWYARFYKSRGLSSKAILGGKVRVNSNKIQRVKSEQPNSFEARPDKLNKIDPDNPFAAALMDFSKKN